MNFEQRRKMMLRAHQPHVWVWGWIAKTLTKLHRRFTTEQQQMDEALVEYALSHVALWYSWGSRFAWAHAPLVVALALLIVGWLSSWWLAVPAFVLIPLTWVGKQTRGRRAASCASCPKRGQDPLGVIRCHGYPGDRTCPCPKWLWWFPSWLKYQRSLRNFRCPHGHW